MFRQRAQRCHGCRPAAPQGNGHGCAHLGRPGAGHGRRAPGCHRDTVPQPWGCRLGAVTAGGGAQRARAALAVGVKGGPHPATVLSSPFLPPQQKQRQQAWFSVTLLPFLPLFCGRSNPALAPCPQDGNIRCHGIF